MRRIDFDAHWKLDRARQLDLLADNVAEGKVDLAEAQQQLREM